MQPRPWLARGAVCLALFQPGVAWSVTESLASLVARDANCENGTWAAPNGLEFNVACGSNYINVNLDAPLPATNIEQCMSACSNYTTACYGVAFNWSSHECQLQGKGVKAENAGGLKVNSALVLSVMYQVNDTSCTDIQTTLTDGAVFNVSCNHDQEEGDDYVPYQHAEYGYPYHADTLNACMKLCELGHPLCRAVSWNADMDNGYGNCRLKSVQSSSLLAANDSTHTAVLQFSDVSTSCSDGSSYTPSGANMSYYQHCDLGIIGTNMTSVHADTLDACMDACSTNTSCVAMLYDTTQEQGFLNCYMKSAVQSSFAQSWTHYAIRSDASSPPVDDNEDKESTNRAWIAGPVIGGVAVVAIVVLGWYFCFHRKKKAQQMAKHDFQQVPPTDTDSYDPSTQYQPPADVGPAKPVELPPHHAVEVNELPSDHAVQVNELPTTANSPPHAAAALNELPAPVVRSELPA